MHIRFLFPVLFVLLYLLKEIAASTTSTKPNIVFILTDDQDLLLNSLDYMPLVNKYLTSQGATFSSYFIPTPVCCPSRASILRGQFAHNTQIIDLALPGGGGKRFHELGLENSTIGTWLKEAGYRTGFHGKYLNQYPCMKSWVPPGWDDWFALCTPDIYNYVNSNYNDNGDIVNVQDYQTDTIGVRAQKFIAESHAKGDPFFLHLSFIAPHAPARPSPKYRNMFADVTLPRPPSYNQSFVRAMPSFIRNLPLFNESQAVEQLKHYRKRLQTLQSVDEYVEKIIEKLEGLNILQDTYIFYSSDNGYHIGTHRLQQGKRTPYEEDIRVPLIVRGPGVLKNASITANTMNIDLAPTFAEIAGATIPSFVDGKSFLPFLKRRYVSDNTNLMAIAQEFRPYVLLEHWGIAAGHQINNTWQGLRVRNYTQNFVYTSWCVRNHEFYNLTTDPYQINNTYATDFRKMRDYDSILRQLFVCRGYDECNQPLSSVPHAEFLPTALTPCFNGEGSPLPEFRPQNAPLADYTKEEEEFERMQLFEAEDDGILANFSNFYFFIMALFVVFSIGLFWAFRNKFSLPLRTYEHKETLKDSGSLNMEEQSEEGKVRKRIPV